MAKAALPLKKPAGEGGFLGETGSGAVFPRLFFQHYKIEPEAISLQAQLDKSLENCS